ncbi:MAG: protein kinase [Sandaracinaceae bacterium]|nr:protein kinase [Sandaracinaceae bacterium]
MGTVVGERYRIEEALGRGGMGCVYRAHDERLDRPVALKLLSPDRIGDATAVTRLIREARATAALEHDHIVPVYDVGGTGDGGAYLAMQLVRGESLRARVARGPLPLDEALSIVRQIGAALAHAHAAGIVHRDVKPDNVMLRADDGRAVVLDFGIAKREEAAPLTAEGAMVGTPAYLAPEQARGEPIDGRADQFALAVVAWELLTGRLPWPGRAVLEVLTQVLEHDPAPLGIAGAPEAALRRALSKDRADRFGSMRELMTALGHVSSDEALARTEAAPVVARAEPPRGSSPARARLAIAGGIAALAVAAGVVYALLPDDASPPPPTAPRAASGVGLLDLPPAPCSPPATETYARAIADLRRGASGAALEGFERAAEQDDACASAHLRVAHLGQVYSWSSGLREHATAARAGADHLSERERALLHALEPVFFEDPPDRAASRARIAELAARFADDAEMLAVFAGESSATADARIDAARRATEIDPAYAVAWEALAVALDDAGRPDEALAALERCGEATTGESCLVSAVDRYALANRCEPIPELARSARARAPRDAAPCLQLARAYAVEGAPEERIRAQIDEALRLRPDPVLAAGLGALLAGHLGDHERVLELAIAAEATAREADVAGVIITATALRIAALQELGRDEEAGQVARSYVLRSTGTLASVTHNGLRALREANILRASRAALGEADFARERERWTTSLSGNGAIEDLERWAMTDAAFATTPDEARAALERAPGPLPTSGEPVTLAFGGEALALAGRPAEAIERLRAVAESCLRLHHPYASIRAAWLLGQAQRDAGDLEGACASWAALEARWSAHPSRTVDAARALREATCP